ncbi:MAG TPA: GNAT family N-acetyltransferase [Nitrospiraceae bacterium]|nr:GNAT family N-acetyltransferase [Nitrospiraceae bacterium]
MLPITTGGSSVRGAVSAGVWHAAIYDVVVFSEYQGKGIGTWIVRRIQEANVDVIVFFRPGKEAFGNKLGLRKMKRAMAVMSNQSFVMRRRY